MHCQDVDIDLKLLLQTSVKMSVYAQHSFAAVKVVYGCIMSFARSRLQIQGIVLGKPFAESICMLCIVVHAPVHVQYELVCYVR